MENISLSQSQNLTTLVTRSPQMARIVVKGGRNYTNRFKRSYLKIIEHFLQFLSHFSNVKNIFLILKKKDQLHSLNISEVIDLDKCGYFNARELAFSNTLPQETCSRVPNTARTSTTTLLSQFSINLGQSYLENIFLNPI